MELSLLQLPTLATLLWIAYEQRVIKLSLSFLEGRIGNVEKMLNIPVQTLVANIKSGDLTLSEKAARDLTQESNIQNEDSLISSTKKQERQSL